MNRLVTLDALEAYGAALIVAGVALVCVPAAVVLAGVLLVGWANLRDVARRKSAP